MRAQKQGSLGKGEVGQWIGARVQESGSGNSAYCELSVRLGEIRLDPRCVGEGSFSDLVEEKMIFKWSSIQDLFFFLDVASGHYVSNS